MTTQSQSQSQPSSPLSTKFKPTSISTHLDPTQIIPQDDPSRTSPLHPSLPTIKLPPSTLNANINPLTLKPFTADDLKHNNYHALRALGPESARKARDEAVAELKGRLDEHERRAREVEAEIDEKKKTREIERKVWMKRRGEGGTG